MNKLMWMIFSVVMISCQGLQQQSAKNELPGTYVRSFEHEFAKGVDTLHIRTDDGLHYGIDRSSTFYRIRGDKVLPAEQTTEHWSGEYNEQKNAVIENRTGKVIRFDPDDGKLYVGGSVYEKVK